MIKAGQAYDQRNEFEHREDTQRELAQKYDKRQDIIIPYGRLLGFNGSNGEQVVLSYDGAFKITIDGATVVELATDTALTTLEGLLSASYGVTVDANGRIASLKLLSNGDTSDIVFTADSFKFYDGTSDRALFDASGGVVTVNGDVAVSGSIRVGDVRWPVALQTKKILAADGGAIQWAAGAALSAIPDYSIIVPGGVALAAGEAWEPPTLTSVTTTGATLRLKISTPGATSSVTDTTDSAGGVGDPTRVMDKADSADAYDGVYNFRVQGTLTVTSEDLGFGTWFHSGTCTLSTWFDDGGGWDAGPQITLTVVDVLGYDTSGADMTGSEAFDETVSVAWGSAIGLHGGKEYGVSLVSGGTLTDFVSVQYTKQSTSGVRTGSPNGETATILVLPRNV